MEPSSRVGTLIAPVSPPGLAAVALLHLSGPDASVILDRLTAGASLRPGVARHVWLEDADGGRLDDALIMGVPESESYTGHPLYEIGVHGGRAVVRSVLDAAAGFGGRVVTAAELLAFGRERGALDAFAAAAHRRIRRGVVSMEAAAVLGHAWSGRLQRHLRRLLDDRDPAAVETFVAASRRALRWFRPLRVTLEGRPNAGKSTLFNALVGDARATVSADAGTTRDAVEADLVWAGRPVRLVDTAGDADDALTRQLLARADVRLLVSDVTDRDPPAPPAGESRFAALRLPVLTKRDLAPGHPVPAGAVAVSGLTGDGRGALIGAIQAALGPRGESSQPVLFCRSWIRRLAILSGRGAPSRAAAEWFAARLPRRRTE